MRRELVSDAAAWSGSQVVLRWTRTLRHLPVSPGPDRRGAPPDSSPPAAFWGWKRKILPSDVEQALAHPNWNMGAKISVDSATMMNIKGWNLLRPCAFTTCPRKISHCDSPRRYSPFLVECDHAVLAQLGVPDMRLPIHLQFWPGRLRRWQSR